jgi:hypothetical protein
VDGWPFASFAAKFFSSATAEWVIDVRLRVLAIGDEFLCPLRRIIHSPLQTLGAEQQE